MNEIFGTILFSIFITSCVALLLISIRYSTKVKYAIIAVSGTIMIAHGSRMISQTLLNSTACYRPNLFDLIFDWLTLILLGVFVAWFGFGRFYLYDKKLFDKTKK
jgi:hypothetical protein